MIDPKEVAILLRGSLGDSIADSDLFLAINLWLDRPRIEMIRAIDRQVGDRWRIPLDAWAGGDPRWREWTEEDAALANRDRERYEKVIGRATMVEVER